MPLCCSPETESASKIEERWKRAVPQRGHSGSCSRWSSETCEPQPVQEYVPVPGENPVSWTSETALITALLLLLSDYPIVPVRTKGGLSSPNRPTRPANCVKFDGIPAIIFGAAALGSSSEPTGALRGGRHDRPREDPFDVGRTGGALDSHPSRHLAQRPGASAFSGTDRRRLPLGGSSCTMLTCSPTSGVRAHTEQGENSSIDPVLRSGCPSSPDPGRRSAQREHRIASDGSRERRGRPGRASRGRVWVRRRPRQPTRLHRPVHL